MKEDKFLQSLARVAREDRLAQPEEEGNAEPPSAGQPDAHLDARWEDLCLGKLGVSESEDMRRLGRSSDEGKVLYEAFRPLGPEFEARMLEQVRRELKPPGSIRPEASPEPSASVTPAKPPAPVVPIDAAKGTGRTLDAGRRGLGREPAVGGLRAVEYGTRPAAVLLPGARGRHQQHQGGSSRGRNRLAKGEPVRNPAAT